MISLSSLDEQGQAVENFTSDTLPTLLMDNTFDLSVLLPALNLPMQEWHADDVVDALQSLYGRVTPQETITPGSLISMPESDLSAEDRTSLAGQSVRRFSYNDEAYIEFEAPVVGAAPTSPVGYDDLGSLLGMLKRARNEGLLLETLSL